MNRSRKLLTTALAATMLVRAVAVSTPAGADWVSGWRAGFGPGWGYGGWMLGAGVARARSWFSDSVLGFPNR
jgi:hypothetical protein